MRRLYLGLDASTQSLTAVALEADGHSARVVHEWSLAFDDALPAGIAVAATPNQTESCDADVQADPGAAAVVGVGVLAIARRRRCG